MANHDDDTGQQEHQRTSTEWVSSGGQAPKQEEGRHTGQDASDQDHQGLVPLQEAAYEHSDQQEHGMAQGELDIPPQGALEPVAPTSDHQDDEAPGSSPEEQPEREVVPVSSEPPGAAGE